MTGLFNDAYEIFFFFLIFFIKPYVVGTHLNNLIKAIQMSTNNICFYK